jgi:nucleotide-binding universal stress UspA family protein
MKILLAVDGSPYTKRMLAWLAAHEWLTDAHQFTVAHAVTPLPHHAASTVGAAIAHGYYEDDAETVFRPIREFLAEKHVAAEFVHRVGRAGSTLAELAETPPHELIVMGSHGHGGFAGLVLGSVTTEVLARSRVPVLVIR